MLTFGVLELLFIAFVCYEVWKYSDAIRAWLPAWVPFSTRPDVPAVIDSEGKVITPAIVKDSSLEFLLAQIVRALTEVAKDFYLGPVGRSVICQILVLVDAILALWPDETVATEARAANQKVMATFSQAPTPPEPAPTPIPPAPVPAPGPEPMQSRARIE